MGRLLEIIDIIKLALALYRRSGYEMAKHRLVEELERRDDDYTKRELDRIIDDDY